MDANFLVLLFSFPLLVNMSSVFLEDSAYSIVAKDLQISANGKPSKSKPVATRNLQPKDIILQRGSGFDPITGIFTAPFPGIYVMSFHSYTVSGSGGIKALLLLNRGVIASGTEDVNVVFKTLVLNLDEGDKLEIVVLWGEIHATESTPLLFNCFQLYHLCLEDECSGIPVRQSAFSVVVTKAIPAGFHVVDNYGVVILNLGDHFDKPTGTFNAGIAGAYYFTVSAVVSDQSLTTKIDLQVNGVAKAHIRARTNETQEVAGLGVILPLARRDAVRLVNLEDSPSLNPRNG